MALKKGLSERHIVPETKYMVLGATCLAVAFESGQNWRDGMRGTGIRNISIDEGDEVADEEQREENSDDASEDIFNLLLEAQFDNQEVKYSVDGNGEQHNENLERIGIGGNLAVDFLDYELTDLENSINNLMCA